MFLKIATKKFSSLLWLDYKQELGIKMKKKKQNKTINCILLCVDCITQDQEKSLLTVRLPSDLSRKNCSKIKVFTKAWA